MSQNDLLKRYLDAGLAFTALTQARAEALVKDLVKAGEVQADQARAAVTDLVDRSRKNSEQLLETVRAEVKAQISSLGLASKADIERFEARLATLLSTASKTVKKAPAKKKKAAPAKKKAAPAKKKAPAKRATAKKKAAPAKKATARKAPAKKRA